jgi:uncharacterized protein YndB with AHSA1/START domain
MPRTDTASRIIKATPQAIYDAFVDPAALAAWLPPKGMRGDFQRFEPRPGGRYRMTLTYEAPDSATHGKSAADADVVEGKFLELVPGERIVQQADFVSDDPAFAGTMTMSWILVPLPEGTEVTIIADNVPDGIGKADHAAGMASSLENLARFVE